MNIVLAVMAAAAVTLGACGAYAGQHDGMPYDCGLAGCTQMTNHSHDVIIDGVPGAEGWHDVAPGHDGTDAYGNGSVASGHDGADGYGNGSVHDGGRKHGGGHGGRHE